MHAIGTAASDMPWSLGAARSADATAATKNLWPLLKVRIVHATFVGLLVVLQYTLQLAASLSYSLHPLVEIFAGMIVHNLPIYIVGFSIIAIFQVQFAPGRRRTILLIAALLVWIGCWCAASAQNSQFIIVRLGLVSPANVALSGLWTGTTYLMLAVWYYESADRARRSTAVLRASELARQGAERWLLELRLTSLQARLDPRVLFDTLDEVSRVYRSHPATAGKLLDALIDYLRCALPRLRQTESTLRREVLLALAYVRMLRSPAGSPLELEASVEASAGDARFPPMVVQPICDVLARAALVGDAPARLRISAVRERNTARLSVTAESVHAAPAGERMAEVRRTLRTMFDSVGRMETTCHTPGVATVLVEVPYVQTARADR